MNIQVLFCRQKRTWIFFCGHYEHRLESRQLSNPTCHLPGVISALASSPEWEQFTSHEDPGCWELATVQLGFRVDFGKGDKNTWIMQVVVVLHWGTHIWKWECGLASQVLGYGYHCFEGLALFSSLFLWPGVLELGWGPYIGKILGSSKYFT